MQIIIVKNKLAARGLGLTKIIGSIDLSVYAETKMKDQPRAMSET